MLETVKKEAMMGDCPGAGSGDPRDYDQRSLDQHRDDNIDEAIAWIKKQGFEVKRIGKPESEEYFVNYAIKDRYLSDCGFHWFVPDGNYVKEGDRKILKAKQFQLFGSTKMIPLNFDNKYRYYIVEKGGENGSENRGK